jgi:beta-glucosidase
MLPARHLLPAARQGITVATVAALACSVAAATGAAATAPTAAPARGAVAAGPAATRCPWVRSSEPVAARVRQVLRRMSLDDKIAMVHGVGFASGTAGYVGHIPASRRLCIPGLNLEDGPQGVADGVRGVTQLPAPVALAAAWDPPLARAYGAVVGSEERGKGADVNLGPTVNIVRDPRWGRAFESYGEDPYLSGQTAAGYIEGVQRQRVMAQVKHWAVYNQETSRNTPADDALISKRAMHEIYLPQFGAAVTRAGASSVMCSYSTVNGRYACQNGYLMNVLKRQWRFPGFVTSDWGATHSTVPSALAGLDMQMPGGRGFGPDYYGQPLKQAVRAGRVPVATLNGMVSRILTELFRFGLFAHPPAGSLTRVVTTAGHARTGRRVAEAGTVLLKNAGRTLPLRPGRDGSIAVIGSDGGRFAVTSGGGSAHVIAPYVVTPRQAISRRAAASGVTVRYAEGDIPPYAPLGTVPRRPGARPFPAGGATPGWDPRQPRPLLERAVAAAKKASVAVVFAANFEAEGADLPTIGLPASENRLISAVAAANPRTVVVLNTGSAVTMPWLARAKAVIEAWYPGQDDGDEIAAVLFGDVNPSGKLPVTFPRSLAQVPARTAAQWPGTGGKVRYSEGVLVGYRWYATRRTTPLFPFGAGLSYTTFAFTHLTVTPVRSGAVTVTAGVTNTGNRTGTDVAQAYVGDPPATGEPAEQLRAFRRVTLRPGRTTHVRFTLPVRAFAWWNARTGRWTVTPGSYTVRIGDSSAHLPLTGRVTMP